MKLNSKYNQCDLQRHIARGNAWTDERTGFVWKASLLTSQALSEGDRAIAFPGAGKVPCVGIVTGILKYDDGESYVTIRNIGKIGDAQGDSGKWHKSFPGWAVVKVYRFSQS